jgi:hypothetical protein
MSDSSDNYIGVLLEQIRDEVKAVHEAVGDIQHKVDNQPTRDEFNELKDDVRVVKAAVTDQNKQMQDYGHRIDVLEGTN